MTIQIKAQFNPSTLKALFNPVTKKQLFLVTCPGCASSGTFTFSFSGITECSSPAEPFPSSPNITFELTYYGHCEQGDLYSFFGQNGDWMVTMYCDDSVWKLQLYYIVDDIYYVAYMDNNILDPCKDNSSSWIEDVNCGDYQPMLDRCTWPYNPYPKITGYGGTCSIKYSD